MILTICLFFGVAPLSIERTQATGGITPHLTQSLPSIQAPQAWASGFNGTGITIAVLDTGIYAEHDALRDYDQENFTAKIVGWYDAFFPTNLTPGDMSLNGHGTHVASIAAGHRLFNGTAPGANLVAINIYNMSQSGPDATEESVERAINWTIDNRTKFHIRVASMSFGRDPFSSASDPLTNMVSRLVDAGIVAVASAGNEGTHGSKSVTAPGDNPYVITVGAVDDSNAIYSLSGRGPTRQEFSKPDVVAPGVTIQAAGIDNPTAMATLSGTSMAVPHVAGAAAILLQANASLTPAHVKSLLCATAYKTHESGGIYDEVEGYGKIQIQSALDALQLEWDFASLPQETIHLSKNGDGVWARQVHLEPGRIYTFRATGTAGGRASVSVFQMQPDLYGRPQLIKTNWGSHLDRIAFEVLASQDAIIVVKICPSSQDDAFLVEQFNDPLYMGLLLFATGSCAWGVTVVIGVLRLRTRR